jgi:hypothetical protein
LVVVAGVRHAPASEKVSDGEVVVLEGQVQGGAALLVGQVRIGTQMEQLPARSLAAGAYYTRPLSGST